MVIPCQIITQNPSETAKVGQKLAALLNNQRHLVGESKLAAKIVCLYGDLGSGKTTFIQGFAQGFGISSRLLSPTFIIVRRYRLNRLNIFFYHIDLYRIKSTPELTLLGLNEIFANPGSIVNVEWAEKLGKLLPKTRIDIDFKIIKDDSRLIKISQVG